MDAYVAQKIDHAKFNGLTSIVGPDNRLRGGGRTKAQWATQPLKGNSPYIGEFFVSFLSCRTNCFLDVCRRRGSLRRVGSKCTKERTSISWTSVHLILINNTCVIQSRRSLK